MRLLDSLRQDVRFAVRALAKTPLFTSAATLTLGLGIGANTAIFSVINTVLLSPLPFSQPDRRVMIWSRWTGWDKTWVSEAEVLDYRERGTTFHDVAAWSVGRANLTGDADVEPERVGSASVTANTFRTLGAEPLVGRVFTAEEDRAGNDRVVVLGYRLWRRRYGGDPGLVGRQIPVNGTRRTVVGVMPPEFQLPTDFTEDVAEPTELWTPLLIDRADPSRGSHGLYAAATLAPGATVDRATSELRAITASLTDEGHYHAAMQFDAFAVSVEDEILGRVRRPLALVFGAVGFLLLIACANVANLLLARAESRQRELAVRTALGAGRTRITRQLLTESLVLAITGAALGIGLAYVGTSVLTAWDPATVPRASDVELDPTVLLFTAVVAILTAVVFGIAPAVQAVRVDVNESLKEGALSSTAAGAPQRFRSALVVAQTGLAVVLLLGAGLMIRSLWALQQIDIGLDPRNVLTMRLAMAESDYPDPPRVVAFYQQLVRRVRRLPGVRQAGAVRSLPLGATIGDWGLDVDGFVETPGNHAKGDWQVVTDGSFETFGERLIRGRFFTASDRSDSQPVAIVNETMAKAYWKNGDALGGRIRMGGMEDRPWLTVVGIAGDVKHNSMTGLVKEKFYVPHSQFHLSVGSAIRDMTLVVKTDADPSLLVGPVRREVRALDPNVPIAAVRPMTDVVASSVATQRFTAFLLALFAGIALVLSAIGVYGVLSYLVSQRTREIGIRMAIGAGRPEVMRLVLRRGVALSAIGLAIGVAAGFLVTRLMAGLLYGVQATDATTFLSVPVVLGAVAVCASFIPAFHAAQIDPLRALRSE